MLNCTKPGFGSFGGSLRSRNALIPTATSVGCNDMCIYIITVYAYILNFTNTASEL